VDGLGWLPEKVFRVMSAFGMTWDEVTVGLTGAKGWALYVWAIENEARVWGGQLRRTSDGYVKQECKRIMNRK